MSDLPYAIKSIILLKLPARSLLRFNLVCKRWRSLISNPNFVKHHAKHALLDQSNNHRKVITDFVHSEDDYRKQSMISLSIDYESLNFTNFQFEFKSTVSPKILGCCNGLLLLDSRFILNPILPKKYKLLPSFNTDLCLHRTLLCGFGYVPPIDDYKVVRLNKYYVSRSCSKLQFEVYSLKTDSWKAVQSDPRTRFLRVSSKAGTHVRGSIYWVISYSDSHNVVLGFDLITETFKHVETPWGDKEYPYWPLELVNVRGYLGIYCSSNSDGEIVIWILNEDENKKGGYWMKFLTIPRKYPKFTGVLSILNNNEVLLYVIDDQDSRKLVIYDVAWMMFRDIPCGEFRWPIYHMVETLVSPGF